MQKSLAGLCRSLLYEVLKERPDLVPDTFPEYWSKAKQAPWITDDKLEIPTALIKDSLNRLLRNPQIYDKHSFCFFIDGLDGFEPGLQDGLDYLDLVDILRQWTVHRNGSLKLCVSSREEGVFMDEYTNDSSLRLQDLTKFDMENYVRSRLQGLKNKTLRDEFINLIPKKSSGIFLWTYLVVISVRSKMSHKVSDEVLEKHLETLPEVLKALFQHVLQNLEPDDRIWTLRTIDLLQTAKSNNLDLTLFASSLLEEYDTDPKFSMRDDLDELQKDDYILRAQLRGACGGLIEYRSKPFGICGDVLDFVHRSVPEMFQGSARNTELSSQMEHALSGTDTIDVLTHICFAAARIRKRFVEHKSQLGFASIALLRLRKASDEPPYSFLEYINPMFDSI